MATSYTNPLGSGDRTAGITVTTDFNVENPLTGMVDGDLTSDQSNYFPFDQATAGKYIEFALSGTPRVIDAFKLYKEEYGNDEEFKIQGFDGSTWVDLSNITISSTLGEQEFAFTNTTPYQSYRLLGVSGTLADYYWFEMEFRIDEGAPEIISAAFEDGTVLTVDMVRPAHLVATFTDETTFVAFIEIPPPAVDTAYTGYGGAGMRQSIYTITTDLTHSRDLLLLINGNQGAEDLNSFSWDVQDVAGKVIEFEFNGDPRVINGFKLYREAGGAGGLFKFQGFNGVSWVNLADVSITTDAEIEVLFDNTFSRQRYRLLGVSGSLTTNRWYEIEFKTNGTSFDSGDRRSVITITSDIPLGDPTFNVGRDITTAVDGLYQGPDDSVMSFWLRPSENIAGKEIRMVFSNPVAIKHVAWQSYAAGASGAVSVGTWRWQGSQDGSTWVNLGDVFDWQSNYNNYNDDFQQYLENSTEYLVYRLLGVSGTIGAIVQFSEALLNIVPLSESSFSAAFEDNTQMKIWVNRPPFIPFAQVIVIISGT